MSMQPIQGPSPHSHLYSTTALVEPPASTMLEAELDACLPIFPTMCQQLREAVSTVEDAVVGVCSNFHAMVERARSATADLDNHADGGPSVMGIIGLTRGTLNRLLIELDESASQSHATAEKMLTVQSGMEAIARNLQQLDRIANHARIVALNGAIEAARAGGTVGAAFGTVALATRALADNVSQFSATMRDIAQQAHREIQTTAEHLRECAQADVARVQTSRQDVELSLDAMEKAHTQMEAQFERSRVANEALARDVSRAVIGMQFQDAISQRVGHVIELMEAISTTLQHRRNHPQDTDIPVTDWIERMASRYAMAAERRVLASCQGAAQQQLDIDNDDSIELF